MEIIYPIFAFLPLIFLLVLSLLKGVKTGVFSSLIITSILFFLWDSAWPAFPAAFIAALIDTIGILMIVFGAILLYHTMERKGFIGEIMSSLQDIHPERKFRFYFLAFFLTAFFESVAGFGTPGAIVPLLLISMGYPAVMSISAVLLIDGLFAVSGAIGTPVTAGLAGPLGLPAAMVKEIYLYATICVAASGFILLFIIQDLVNRENGTGRGQGLILYLSLMVPFVGLGHYLQELAGLMAALIMALVSYFFFFTNKKLKWRPWIPYVGLVVLLLIPKGVPSFADFLAWELSFDQILGTEVSTALQPLRSPFFPFVIATVVAGLMSGNLSFDIKPIFSRTGAVFLVLFPSLAITRLMLASGTAMPSMVEMLAEVFVQSGSAYPVLSPFIGVLGAFITGSTTVSNVIFGPVQYNAAQHLQIPEAYILALQLTGASLGNAVCLFNIIAASAVAGVENYAAILKKNLLPILGATLLASLVGYILIMVN